MFSGGFSLRFIIGVLSHDHKCHAVTHCLLAIICTAGEHKLFMPRTLKLKIIRGHGPPLDIKAPSA